LEGHVTIETRVAVVFQHSIIRSEYNYVFGYHVTLVKYTWTDWLKVVSEIVVVFSI